MTLDADCRALKGVFLVDVESFMKRHRAPEEFRQPLGCDLLDHRQDHRGRVTRVKRQDSVEIRHGFEARP